MQTYLTEQVKDHSFVYLYEFYKNNSQLAEATYYSYIAIRYNILS
jgi:hypothetical protein